MSIEESLVRRFTGMVVDSLALDPDMRGGIECAACDDVLRSGDRVTATITCYENHSWEITGVYCEDHAVDSVVATMGVAPEDQAVVAAVLEGTGYHSPDGAFYPDALTFGAVDVLDFSPAADGYPE